MLLSEFYFLIFWRNNSSGNLNGLVGSSCHLFMQTHARTRAYAMSHSFIALFYFKTTSNYFSLKCVLIPLERFSGKLIKHDNKGQSVIKHDKTATTEIAVYLWVRKQDRLYCVVVNKTCNCFIFCNDFVKCSRFLFCCWLHNLHFFQCTHGT